MTVFVLSTGHEIGLGLIALAFVVFALLSSMVLPRYRPGFPGRNLTGFVLITICLFGAMLWGIFYFGAESKAENAALGVTAKTQPPGGPVHRTGVTTNATTPKQNAPPTTTTPSKAALTLGKSLFQQNCGGCHTLKDAGTSGSVGPNLDQKQPSQQKVILQVTNGGGVMPAFKGRLSTSQIQAVAAYVSSVAGKS